ncbi:MAG: hypothetical protein V9E94_16315 [Microthrixaceae bacterium]
MYLREPVARAERLTLTDHWSDDLEATYSACYRLPHEYRATLERVFTGEGFRFTLDTQIDAMLGKPLRNDAALLRAGTSRGVMSNELRTAGLCIDLDGAVVTTPLLAMIASEVDMVDEVNLLDRAAEHGELSFARAHRLQMLALERGPTS